MPNLLAHATSPYLRLHAENPVDWLPWGEEAFARARELDRPIFLSIGYFTCHWCHVMEHESFADPATAELLNREFISIKVDREERPDVDRLYMAFVQATTGGGGWPLSAFLTPDLVPFYGGTYFPAVERHGLPSFRRLLATLAAAWHNQREQLLASAADIRQFLDRSLRPAAPAPASAPALLEAVWPRLRQELGASFDSAHGGFGGAPKFPRPAAFAFLLRHAKARNDKPAADMVAASLRAIAAGGIHDHLGGGFHRYATDAGWRVPHFEKMLYDQAQLATSFCEAWQSTREPAFQAAARSTCDFVLRELAAPGGGFWSAQDADSPTEHGPAEGAYYLWTAAELVAADAPMEFLERYGVEPRGNIPAQLDPQGEFAGKNILYLARPEVEVPGHAAVVERLYALRRQRPHPPTDDKILTAWNALMISALVQCGTAFQEPRYLAAARACTTWISRGRWNQATGDLVRTPGVAGFAEDYAYLVQAALDLHQADFDRSCLEWARQMQSAMDERFAAPEGGYYSTAPDPRLLLRMREDHDGAEPSPNSVALGNLLRLDFWYENQGWRARADHLLEGFAQALQSMPQALPQMAAWLEVAAAPPRRLLIAGAPGASDTRALLAAARRHFLPGYWLQRADVPADGKAAAYLCEDYTCQLPIHDPEALEAALR